MTILLYILVASIWLIHLAVFLMFRKLRSKYYDLLNSYHSDSLSNRREMKKIREENELLEEKCEGLMEKVMILEKKLESNPTENNWDGIRKAFTRKRVDVNI